MPLQPFYDAQLPPLAFDVEASMLQFKISRQEAETMVKVNRETRSVLNDLYQVNIRMYAKDIIHLSIKRRDKETIHDWRHLQEIKNMLVGPEHEGIELYPAESRLVDEANQYHLWVHTNPTFRFPVGWKTRMTMNPEDAASMGGKQRGFS